MIPYANMQILLIIVLGFQISIKCFCIVSICSLPTQVPLVVNIDILKYSLIFA